MSKTFLLNGVEVEAFDPPETALLWVLRNSLGSKGTKYGCGIAQCGACTVQVDGQAVRSCVTPLSAVVGHEVTTIEGLKSDIGKALKKAWIDEQVPQCGYCQSGQLMQAAALLARDPLPDDKTIDAAMNGNLCRCMTYKRIRLAIKRAAQAVTA